MQNPEGTAAGAAQRQQQAQAAEQQRETAESLALLREAVLRPEVSKVFTFITQVEV